MNHLGKKETLQLDKSKSYSVVTCLRTDKKYPEQSGFAVYKIESGVLTRLYYWTNLLMNGFFPSTEFIDVTIDDDCVLHLAYGISTSRSTYNVVQEI